MKAVRKRIPYVLSAAILLLLAACGAASPALPSPEALWEEIESAARLPEMAVMPEEFLQQNTGIGPEDYESAICCVPANATAPDEIIIILAKDGSADDIMERLENRLAYKEKSAQAYLTEYLPVIQEGVVRRDGRTVSMIVSESIDEILPIYDRYSSKY